MSVDVVFILFLFVGTALSRRLAFVAIEHD